MTISVEHSPIFVAFDDISIWILDWDKRIKWNEKNREKKQIKHALDPIPNFSAKISC